MKKKSIFYIYVAVLSGCANSPEPGKITLEEAMVSVVRGFKQMKQEEGKLRTGLIASEVTATFNVSATKTDTNKLYVEVGAPASAPVSGKIGDEFNVTTVASRGNQVTVKFTNLLLSDEKTLISKLLAPSTTPHGSIDTDTKQKRKDIATKAAPAAPVGPCNSDPKNHSGGAIGWIEECLGPRTWSLEMTK